MRSAAGNVMLVAHVLTQMHVMSWELPLSSGQTAAQSHHVADGNF